LEKLIFMKISIVAAYDQNRLIGKANQLPWSLPHDMKRFKTLTMGNFMIMGRKTFESVEAPLPGRTSIVVTRQAGYTAPAGVHVVKSVGEGVEVAEKEDVTEVFLIGGEEIFRLALQENLINVMYLTEIHAAFEGDTFFPDFDKTLWQETEREHFEPDARNAYAHDFVTWMRK
jgi:dihydrofolate reductase